MRFIRPLLWRLETRFSYRSKAARASFTIANRLPHWLREAVVVNAAVKATHPDSLIGPDSLDYKRLFDHA